MAGQVFNWVLEAMPTVRTAVDSVQSGAFRRRPPRDGNPWKLRPGAVSCSPVQWGGWLGEEDSNPR